LTQVAALTESSTMSLQIKPSGYRFTMMQDPDGFVCFLVAMLTMFGFCNLICCGQNIAD